MNTESNWNIIDPNPVITDAKGSRLSRDGRIVL